MNYRKVEDDLPWYKQFWPWFIILLPASVVVAGITTVFIAFKHADSMVSDDYFKDGLAINKRIEQDQAAKDLGLLAEVSWDALTGELLVSLSQDNPTAAPVEIRQLRVNLLHPTSSNLDSQIILERVRDNYFRGEIASRISHRYYLRLEPASDGAWRLNGEMDFTDSNRVLIQAQ